MLGISTWSLDFRLLAAKAVMRSLAFQGHQFPLIWQHVCSPNYVTISMLCLQIDFHGERERDHHRFYFCSCSMFCNHPPWIKCSSRTWDIHVFIVQRAKPRPCASEGEATAALCTRAANEGMPTRCGRFAVLTRSCCPAAAGDLHWGGIAASIMWIKWPWFIQGLSSKHCVNKWPWLGS